MRRSIKTLAVTSAVIAGLTAAPALYAHDSSESGGSMMGSGMMGQGGMMGMMMGPGMMMGQHTEGRIAFVRAELGITAAQEAQWNAFAEALRTSARAMADMHGQMMPMMMPMMQGGPQAVPLPQRLEWHERMMASHLEALRRVRAAAGPLYAALDDRQKRIADSLMTGMM